ncbi:AAA family ATPase [Antrihabitans spumae]|uniref:AAA family ATPase n=1 Tax=Antrihabitans spumae TaxID=3373370 RepID=A0ABW7KKK3_9NOCA
MSDRQVVNGATQGENDINTEVPVDPRHALAEWANEHDEWIRLIVREVLATRRSVGADAIDDAYRLFRQEKALDKRELPEQPKIEIESSDEEAELPLTITKLDGVTGVNALIPGSVIEPHEGLTILFGENGTGKTGYSRIFKALADSRTADVVLRDIGADSEEPQHAAIAFKLGDKERQFIWSGESGVAPFTRMSIFDTPSVNFHVDDDLEYVYVPTVLALFNHAVAGIKAVQAQIDTAIKELSGGATTLLGRFPRTSKVYPLIETLGATTDLNELDRLSDKDPKVDERIEVLRRAVAALDANTTGTLLKLRQREHAVMTQAVKVVKTLGAFDAPGYNARLAMREELNKDYVAFRTELFKAAALPAEPEGTWESFVASGEQYKQHLVDLSVHDDDKCLYCRQPLGDRARDLVSKYGEYLADKISGAITECNTAIQELTSGVRTLDDSDIVSLLKEYKERSDQPGFYPSLVTLREAVVATQQTVTDQSVLAADALENIAELEVSLGEIAATIGTEVGELQRQDANRAEALASNRKDLTELTAAAELARSWAQIEAQVGNAKEADKLKILSKALPVLIRAVTDLSKTASDQLINQNFDKLFAEECDALRAPSLKLEFVGRQGKAHRRKVMKGKYKPSKILSEGEQKVLAIADFLAEARLAGITAPVIFDDPVSSLDHRRINEVAQRVALLADDNQVIVFTHDIFFATTLLSLFETSKRCVYLQITDEDGKGQVTRASGPRWDSLSNLRGNINKTIEAAKSVEGEARSALVREGYDWIRSWCEVFTETELLQEVSLRYQPNVRMTALAKIKITSLPDAIAVVTRVFEEACRYIAGHSQPLASLGVAPNLPGLQAHWQELQDCRRAYLAA